MKIDLRPRCKRKNCNKIPRGKLQKANFTKHYPGYCSFQCQEWDKLEKVIRHMHRAITTNP
ncbi:MAG: hypothetical protein A2031_08110 [Deltaproteobacteria bacterium RBG_19FT_COMBO_43_11]|nr:MAG: hypothetical protein A2031_08110 [Deltaproteobacteria bacterium RBG_19FT_COMBO_43_11]